MDAEHRHELKRNELAEALSHLKDWREIDRSWFVTIGIVVVAILAWASVRTWTWAAQQAEYSSWAQYQQISQEMVQSASPDGMLNLSELRTAANGGLSSSITPLAKLELAEALCHNASLDSTNRDELLNEAKKTVSEALALVVTMKTPVLEAAALITQASIEEALGEFDAARATYEKLQQPRFAGSPFTTPLGVGMAYEQPSIVEQRLENLDEVSEPTHMLPGSPESEATETSNPSGIPDLSSLGLGTDLDAETNEQAEKAKDAAESTTDTPAEGAAAEPANDAISELVNEIADQVEEVATEATEGKADSTDTEAPATEDRGADEPNAP